jgi:hypothetical protein
MKADVAPTGFWPLEIVSLFMFTFSVILQDASTIISIISASIGCIAGIMAIIKGYQSWKNKQLEIKTKKRILEQEDLKLYLLMKQSKEIKEDND